MERFAKIINKNLHKTFHLRWDEVLKNRPSKICGRQHLKSYLVHSWILGLRCLIEFWICFCTILHERLSNISKDYLVWKTSVIRQKGKRANLKTEVTRKESTPNFPKNTHFYPVTRTRMCAYQEVWNVCFSENLTCFGKLIRKILRPVTPALRFALLPYYRRTENLIQQRNSKYSIPEFVIADIKNKWHDIKINFHVHSNTLISNATYHWMNIGPIP